MTALDKRDEQTPLKEEKKSSTSSLHMSLTCKCSTNAYTLKMQESVHVMVNQINW